ncbi:hypothetical protein AMTRI_Chr11g151840 [Amborella trichopoda]
MIQLNEINNLNVQVHLLSPMSCRLLKIWTTQNKCWLNDFPTKLLYIIRIILLEVIDTSGGCGASFTIEIVSEQFEGKRLLERHRMVNAALAEEMKEIHALSIKKALTPLQWQQQQEAAEKTSQ